MTDESALTCRGCYIKLKNDDVHSFVWPEIKELFEDCTRIKILPDQHKLPQQICPECLSKCEQWHEFKTMCIQVNQHLLENVQDSNDNSLETTVVEDEPSSLIDRLKMQLSSECVSTAQEESMDFTNTFHTEGAASDEAGSSFTPDFVPQEEPKKRKKTKNGPIKCPVCYKRFIARSSLHIHFTKHTKERPYVCTYCNSDYITRNAVQTHIKSHHVGKRANGDAIKVKEGSAFNKKRPWIGYPIDELCEKPHAAKRRSRFNSEPKKKYWNCPVCQKRMKTDNLRTHFVVHTNERPYLCTYCNVDYKFKSHCKEHVNAGNGGIVIKQGSIFQKVRPWEAMGYFLHGKHPTNIQSEEPEPMLNPLQCSVCEKVFGSRYQLLLHSVIHTGERPYKCTYCPDEFKQKSIGIAHVQDVHPDKKQERAIVLNKDTEFGRQLKTLGGNSQVN